MSVELRDLREIALDIFVAHDVLAEACEEFQRTVAIRLMTEEKECCQAILNDLVPASNVIKFQLRALYETFRAFNFDDAAKAQIEINLKRQVEAQQSSPESVAEPN